MNKELYKNFTQMEIYNLIFSQQKIKNEFEKNGYYIDIKRLKHVHKGYSCTFNKYDNYLIITTKKTRKSWWYYFDVHFVHATDILNMLTI